MDAVLLAGTIHNDENPSAQTLGISGERISTLTRVTHCAAIRFLT